MDQSNRAADLQTIVETIWATMLNIPIDRLPTTIEDGIDGAYSARVRISGTWDGTLVLVCSEGLARFVGAALFRMEPWDLDDESNLEAVLELANMIGGNVKALVGQGSQLGLPEVGTDRSWGEPGEQEAALLFDCLGEPLALRLVRAAD